MDSEKNARSGQYVHEIAKLTDFTLFSGQYVNAIYSCTWIDNEYWNIWSQPVYYTAIGIKEYLPQCNAWINYVFNTASTFRLNWSIN